MEHIKTQYCKLFVPGATINIPDGWFWLVSGLCHALDKYTQAKWMQEPLKITRVEQRLGTLCVQYHGGDRDAGQIITAVQLTSNGVCQLCGAVENVGGTFGTALYTICEKCWKLDEQFHKHHFAANYFSEGATQRIKAGLLVMHESWFKKHLGAMI